MEQYFLGVFGNFSADFRATSTPVCSLDRSASAAIPMVDTEQVQTAPFRVVAIPRRYVADLTATMFLPPERVRLQSF